MKSCIKCGKTYSNDATFCTEDGSGLVLSPGSGATPDARTVPPPPAADPMIGKLLAGRYQIQEKIGQGGMGAVYRALHTKMNRVSAVKLLPLQAADADAPARFNREAQMASRIDNAHAVIIYDFGETEDGALYLAMEYIDGQTLSTLLARERKLSADRTSHIIRQIAEALSAAHRLGIVHRDLKPDNIMVCRKGEEIDYVKVLDFGIAKTVDDSAENLTRTGLVLGTPVYMSPEQLSGEKLDARSDLYSLALIAYQMLSGVLPFEGDSAQSIMIKRLTTAPAPLRINLPTVGEGLERAVMSGLERNRDLRPRTAAEFAAGFEAARLNQPTATLGSAGQGSEDATQLTPAKETGRFGAPRETAAPIMPRAAPTVADEMATREMKSKVGTSEQESEPKKDLRPSPQAADYVTRASTSSGFPAPPGGSQPTLVARPPEAQTTPPAGMPPLGNTAVVNRQTPPIPGPYGSPGPTIPISGSGTFPTPGNNAAPKRSGIAAFAIAVLVLGLIGAAGVGGYLLYSKSAKLPSSNPRTNSNARPKGPVSSDSPVTADSPNPGPVPTPSMAASAHYEAGKSHQEQGELLAHSGSKENAIEEYKKAIVEYRQAIQLQPDSPEAHENLGVALYNTGDLEGAIGEYNIAIQQYNEKNGATPKVMTNLGLALFDSRRYQQAADAFSKALELDPNDHDLYVHRGLALQNAGRIEAANADYNRYLKLEPAGHYARAVREILAGHMPPPEETGNH
ncbi:MAG TPA: tetratricopeptide repeat protein [Blastocatellia bacterium]|nr:tetratricopeptide repeat protein [Blastocatellia bacterium]